MNACFLHNKDIVYLCKDFRTLFPEGLIRFMVLQYLLTFWKSSLLLLI